MIQNVFGDVEVARVVALLDILNARDYAKDLETTYYQKAQDAFAAVNAEGEAVKLLQQLVDTLFGRTY